MPRVPGVHVVPYKDQWAVKISGKVADTEIGAPAIYATQQDAINEGRYLAIESKAELLIHGKNGKIRRKHSYGHDPRKIKG